MGVGGGPTSGVIAFGSGMALETGNFGPTAQVIGAMAFGAAFGAAGDGRHSVLAGGIPGDRMAAGTVVAGVTTDAGVATGEIGGMAGGAVCSG